jgi:hypothetical protein
MAASYETIELLAADYFDNQQDFDGGTPSYSLSTQYQVRMVETSATTTRYINCGRFASLLDANNYIAANPLPATIFTELTEPES